jgi:hypothetical protein
MSTGSALLDMYVADKGAANAAPVQKTASMQKTAEEICLEKFGSESRRVFDRALDQYLLDFAVNDLSR